MVENVCIICFKNTINHENVNIVSCGHLFHSQCISFWNRYASICPVCHKELSTVTSRNGTIIAVVSKDTILDKERTFKTVDEMLDAIKVSIKEIKMVKNLEDKLRMTNSVRKQIATFFD